MVSFPVSSEIVGLIPKKALEQAAEWFLQVENFDSSLILENRLTAVMGGKMAVGGLRAGVEPFIEQLAAPPRLPEVGALLLRAVRWRRGWQAWSRPCRAARKLTCSTKSQLSEAITRLSQLREELKAAIDADAESYNLVMKAYKAAKESSGGDTAINAALKQATSVPLAWLKK